MNESAPGERDLGRQLQEAIRDLRHPLIRLREKAVLFALAARYPSIHPNAETLAADAGTTRSKLFEIIRPMKALGLVSARRGGAHGQNVYELNLDALRNPSTLPDVPPSGRLAGRVSRVQTSPRLDVWQGSRRPPVWTSGENDDRQTSPRLDGQTSPRLDAKHTREAYKEDLERESDKAPDTDRSPLAPSSPPPPSPPATKAPSSRKRQRELFAVTHAPAPCEDSAPPDAKPKASRRKAETPIPDAWGPTSDAYEIGAALGFDRSAVDDEAERFRDRALAKDVRNRDWNAAFRNWLRKARDFRGPSPQPTTPPIATARPRFESEAALREAFNQAIGASP